MGLKMSWIVFIASGYFVNYLNEQFLPCYLGNCGTTISLFFNRNFVIWRKYVHLFCRKKLIALAIYLKINIDKRDIYHLRLHFSFSLNVVSTKMHTYLHIYFYKKSYRRTQQIIKYQEWNSVGIKPKSLYFTISIYLVIGILLL